MQSDEASWGLIAGAGNLLGGACLRANVAGGGGNGNGAAGVEMVTGGKALTGRGQRISVVLDRDPGVR